MKTIRNLAFLTTLAFIGAFGAGARAQTSQPAAAGEMQVAVTFSGGYDTDRRDHGRPVILVASALAVKPEVFRDAFSRVKPAGPGQTPDPAQVRLNKQALMNTLAPYGVTDERLNEVSNFYRYNGRVQRLWRHTPAAACATVRDGKVTGITLTNPGAGYTVAPEIEIPGMPEVKATATIAFGTDFSKNGSIQAITLVSAGE